ncbi:MAG: TolC family protein [Prevotella sp.]|jgi:cobalt-zinc-cadmium efflux system outer membrane protein|nr:TolC family protein [Prevotella sp.]
MKKYLLFLIFTLLYSNASSQGKETLKLTPNQIESIFLEQNLQLIAEKMNISLADAEITQAKLWDNPNLSVGGVNLWSTNKQREGESELIPPLFGSFAKNTQFSIELSQLVQTANKKGKLVAREKISKEIAIQEFETVLRGLRSELRKSINEITYLQSYLNVLKTQQDYLFQLIESYRKQVSQGNIAKSELLRLQSSLLEIENDSSETSVELNEQLKNLKILLSINPLINIEIEKDITNKINPASLSLTQLLQQAEENRTDIKKSKLQTKYFEKSLSYEKSQRIPDITLSISYDRFGGVWKDFVGFGVSFDLPILNRNQGAIKAARLNRDQSLYMEKQQINQVQHEVVEAYSNYLQTYDFYQKISNNELLTELDSMLEIYTKNLLNKNVSMIEYIDFMDTYRSNKQTVLTAQKKMQIQFEELQYTIGTEIK